MTGEDIKALRKELACTAKELAVALGLEQATVMAWEKADLFPTKANIDKMEALRAKGPSAIVRKAKATVATAASAATVATAASAATVATVATAASAATVASVSSAATVPSAPVSPVQALAEPLVWELLRKIAAHKQLRDDVAKLAASYADPASRD